MIPYIQQKCCIFEEWNTFVVRSYTYIGLFSTSSYLLGYSLTSQGFRFPDHWLLFYRYLIGLNGWNPPVPCLLAAQNNTITKEKQRNMHVRGGISTWTADSERWKNNTQPRERVRACLCVCVCGLGTENKSQYIKIYFRFFCDRTIRQIHVKYK